MWKIIPESPQLFHSSLPGAMVEWWVFADLVSRQGERIGRGGTLSKLFDSKDLV